MKGPILLLVFLAAQFMSQASTATPIKYCNDAVYSNNRAMSWLSSWWTAPTTIADFERAINESLWCSITFGGVMTKRSYEGRTLESRLIPVDYNYIKSGWQQVVNACNAPTDLGAPQLKLSYRDASRGNCTVSVGNNWLNIN